MSTDLKRAGTAFPGKLLLAAMMWLLPPAAALGVVIDNDVPSGVPGHWAVDVTSGGESASAMVTAERLASGDVFTENVIFAYRSYVDPGNDGGGFRLAGSAPSSDPADADKLVSSGSFTGANGNTIEWTVESVIADGETVMTNVIGFNAVTGTLGPLRFLQYVDPDVDVAFADDVLFVRGSSATDDLEVACVDGPEVYGVSQSGALSTFGGLTNFSFAGFAADVVNNLDANIRGAGQPVAPAGVISNLASFVHPQVGAAFGPADTVSVFAWDVDPNASQAKLRTTLRGIPDLVEPRCGNGELEAGEECDDGNLASGDGCSSSCKLEEGPSCGDGTLDDAEECDDGNLDDADGCSASCKVEDGVKAADLELDKEAGIVCDEDFDNDGVDNDRDRDDDNDGKKDSVDPDDDNDGFRDTQDRDNDNDGISGWRDANHCVITACRRGDDADLTADEICLVDFRLTAHNAGPDDATGVQLRDLLPRELQLESASPDAGSYDGKTGLWNIGALEAGETASLLLRVKVLVDAPSKKKPGPSCIPNTAEVTAASPSDPDSVPGNADPGEDDEATAGVPLGYVGDGPLVCKD